MLRVRSTLMRGLLSLACTGVVLLASGLHAYAKSWRIANFKDNINISQDGSTLVVEHIDLVFIGEWHGIHRIIPVEYPGPGTSNYTLFLDVKSVSDGNGNSLRYESKTSRGYRDLKIYIPGAIDNSRTVEITYTIKNAIRYFENYDEFYWNVTGNDWPVPIDHAEAFVSLPVATAGSLRAQAFTGVYGSTEGDATATVQGADVTFETMNPLPMRGGVTIDVYIPKGFLKEPSGITRVIWFLGSNPIILMPLFTFAVMFLLWRYKGRDPDPGVSVAPMYEPPNGMTPAEVGTLIDDSVDPRDITSTIVDLAVRGYIKIEETTPQGLIFKSKDYVLHLLKPRDQWTSLASHEVTMLDNIFEGGNDIQLSSLKNQFYTAVPKIRNYVMSALKAKGMYLVDPDSANIYNFLAIIIILIPFGLLQLSGRKDMFASVPLLIGSLLVSAVIWYLFARVMSAKTILGGKTRVAILGFQEFMNRVDADRLKRMPPDAFEKYLPYAMALGVENRWAQAFAGIIQNPPTWYTSPTGGPFNPIYFSNSMHTMASDMHQVFTSAPRSSSSGSGFSGGGGGFSGGGFGGGGGSAF